MTPEPTPLDSILKPAETEEYLLAFVRLSTLGLLSSAIMHDVRNALTVLSGNAQILQMKGEGASAAEIAQRLERMMAQVERMERQIGRVESYSRRAEGTQKSLLPRGVIENALLTIEPFLMSVRLQLNLDPAADQKQIFGDPGLLEFVVTELLRLAIHEHREGELAISSSDCHPYWEMRIEMERPGGKINLLSGGLPGLRLAELVVRRLGGELVSLETVTRAGWRVCIPWRICAESVSED